jgi:hypothetical protein
MAAHKTDLAVAFAGNGSGPLSDEARRSLALQHYTDHLSQPDADMPFVAPETMVERDRLWQRWIK